MLLLSLLWFISISIFDISINRLIIFIFITLIIAILIWSSLLIMLNNTIIYVIVSFKNFFRIRLNHKMSFVFQLTLRRIRKIKMHAPFWRWWCAYHPFFSLSRWKFMHLITSTLLLWWIGMTWNCFHGLALCPEI